MGEPGEAGGGSPAGSGGGSPAAAGASSGSGGSPASPASGASGGSPSGGAQHMQRVKLYKLNETGVWDDKGTGHVSVEYMEVRARCSARARAHAGCRVMR
jgi:hypothetical protein